MDLEKKLGKLFDYQKFEKNPALERLIRETESRYREELSDDELSFVAAAGEVGNFSQENRDQHLNPKMK